ncbi:MAG: hypothetical protein P8080_03865 [Gammaproteobacteria bacterium]
MRIPRACLVALAIGAAAGCGPDAADPEATLRSWLTEAEAYAEAGDAQALAGLISPDYSDMAGRDRRQASVMLKGLLLRYPRLELVVTERDLELFSPVLARARLQVIAAGAGAGRLSADGFTLELSLRDDGDGWRVTGADWDGAPPGI